MARTPRPQIPVILPAQPATQPPSVTARVLAHIKRFWFVNELQIAEALDLPVLDVLEALLELERTDPDVVTRDGVIGYIGHTDRVEPSTVDMSDVTTEDANERRWIETVRQDAEGQLCDREKEALAAAELNAGMTGDERGYADFTADWYRVFVDSYELMLDTLP